MAINYSFNSLNSQGPTVSYRNVSNQTLSFNINGTVYTVAPSNTLTLPESSLFDSGINNALSAGTLIKINVFGVLPTSTPTGPGGESINSPIIATNVGGFSGVEEDSDGYWVLPSGNTIIYPLNKNFKHQKPGINSIVSLSAAMRRTSIDIGNLGFAIYTDTKTKEYTFKNGYLVYWNQDGTGSVYRVVNGTQYPLSITQEQSYVIDEEFHRFSVYIYQTAPGQMEFFLYSDGNPVAQAIDLDNGYTGGAVGFSTSQGTLPVYIQPGSFEIKHGAAEQASFPANLQTIINNSTVVVNTTGLSGVNLIPDSGFIFANTYWDFSFAGTLTITNAVGVDGGNGVVYTQGASPGGPGSAIFFSTYGSDNALELINIPLKANKKYCLSMNVDATNVTSGWPMIGIYKQDKTQAFSTATQSPGTNGIIQCTYKPSVDTSVVILCSMGDPLAPGDGNSSHIPQLTANGTITFSCPQLELGDHRTNYVQTLFPNTSPVVTHTVLGSNPNPNTPPTISGFSGFTYTDAGNITYTATASFTVDQHHPSWLSGVGIYLTRYGSAAPIPNQSTLHTFLPIATGGTYTTHIHNIPTNVTAGASNGYNIYATYIDNQHTASAISLIGTTVANPVSLPGTSLAQMPATIEANGPTISTASASRVAKKGTLHEFTVVFTETDFGSLPNWLSCVHIKVRNNGSTDHTHHVKLGANQIVFVSGHGNGTKVVHGALGQIVDIGFAYEDISGNISATTWPSSIAGITDPAGDFADPITGHGLHSRMSDGVQAAVNASGQGLLNEFPGATLNQDGSLTNVNGITSTRTYPGSAGTVFRIGAHLQHSVLTAEDMGIVLGTQTNGYGVWHNNTDGHIYVSKWVNGTRTDLSVSSQSFQPDLKPHHFRLTVLVNGVSSNEIEATVDSYVCTFSGATGITDTSLNLTSYIALGLTPYWGTF